VDCVLQLLAILTIKSFMLILPARWLSLYPLGLGSALGAIRGAPAHAGRMLHMDEGLVIVEVVGMVVCRYVHVMMVAL
jgi:hypothetical protein